MKPVNFQLILSGCIILLLSGCGAKKLPPPEWHFQQAAIKVSLTADPSLNLFDETPHTLFMCIYQLSDPNAFNVFIQNSKGISDLLACNRFDPSAVSFKRVIVQPGSEQDLIMDRAEGAKYVGIVAGYFALYKESSVRLLDIPVVVETKGFIRKTKTKKPGKLAVKLYLGPQGIKETGVKSEF